MSLSYTIKEGFSGFARARLAAFTSVATITISLLLLGIFFVVTINTSRIVNLIKEKVEMEAFLQEPVTRQQINELRQSILKIEGVESVIFISKEEAAAIFKKEFGEDIASVLDFNPLPPSYKIFLKDDYKNSKNANEVYANIKTLKGVDDVIYRKDLIEFLEKRTRIINLLGLIVGIIVGISAIFLVSNTIRLAIYSKRKIIQTMKLVGATRWFIRMPFLLEGIIQGVLGGIISCLILYSILGISSAWFISELKEFLKIDFHIYGLLFILGIVLGFLGSIISIRKFIGESVIN
jgi:cell division transport system permease protein